MIETDYKNFCSAWLSAHAMSSSNQTPSPDTVMAVFDVLIDYPVEHVLSAIKVHARKSRFAPTPADICDIIDARTGGKHVGADEAWGIAMASFDEASTVVVTSEIMSAREAAADIFHSGDVTGARMAFRAAYERIVQAARIGKPKWFISAGHDGARRADAIQEGIKLGRLPNNAGIPGNMGGELLLGQESATATVAGLIEDASKRENSIDPMAAIGRIRSILDSVGDDGIARRQVEREKAEQHRKNVLDRADAFMRRKSA